ncbi:hypothetical protein [Bosea sp. (in: a-proteobacteria)]|jgi:hypothetical protein|uniref:hypothetical protein n=1 Tax=Bosea sp. (in: a-proteobacteria) TaxID=1871050 RepID=UPI0035656FB4
MARTPKSVERKAAEVQKFVQLYARKAQRGVEPNDRRYDRKIEVAAKRMKPDDLDALLRQGEDE